MKASLIIGAPMAAAAIYNTESRGAALEPCRALPLREERPRVPRGSRDDISSLLA